MLNKQPVETTLYSLDQNAPKPAQRRKTERHFSLLRVGAMMIGDRRELCLIKNVSAGGMLIRTYSPIEDGASVSIELKQGAPLSGTVRWSKDDCIGVTFDSPIDVLELISISVDGPKQRLPRVEVERTAWIRDGATMHRAKTVNISQGGVRVVTSGDLPLGGEVVVTLVDLSPIAGTVRWRDGDHYGIGFNRPLTLPVVVAWLRDQQDQLKLQQAG